MTATLSADRSAATAAVCEPNLVSVEVHVATLDVGPVERETYQAMLLPDEVARAARFHFASDAERYIVRRGKLRELLAARLGYQPRDVALNCNSFGKPRLRCSELRFNLSHSGGVALYVFARGCEIGCDIEWRRPGLAREEVAERFFSDGELRSLRAVPHNRWVEAFFNCWTRKEAFIKALGFGVSYPLKAFDVSLVPGEPAALLRGPLGWSLRSFEPIDGLQAAIAIKDI
jgi:4'-phosphopantetheinyl transferase